MFSLSAIKNLFKDDKLFVDLTTNGVLNQLLQKAKMKKVAMLKNRNLI